jgi:nucleotide-binding universal stress UspA family protein
VTESGETGERGGGAGAAGSAEGEPATPSPIEEDEEYFRVLVPIARPDSAPSFVALAEHLAQGHDRTPIVQVLTVTQIPDQTPQEMVVDTAGKRADRIEEILAADDHPVEYTIEAHTCRDVAFDVLQTAREDGADLILMGYPEESDELTETVEYKAPCDVVFASGFNGESYDSVAVGAGGGPHHGAALPMVRALGRQGAGVHVVSVDPEGPGTPEDPGGTVAELGDLEELHVHNVSAETIERGLVDVAEAEGAILVIGASRDRRLRQWVFGSTPDRVVERAEAAGVPVLVYARPLGVPERVEDYVFPVYRYLRGRLSG